MSIKAHDWRCGQQPEWLSGKAMRLQKMQREINQLQVADRSDNNFQLICYPINSNIALSDEG
jgi:hypothetical protein